MSHKIVVVDDDVDMQNLLKLHLANAGYEVTSALGPIEAFKQMQKDRPDLIILDVMMPKMTGYEFLKFVRENAKEYSSIPVIAISSRESVESCFNSWDLYKFLKKPFTPKELLEVVSSALGLKKAEGISKTIVLPIEKKCETIAAEVKENPIHKRKAVMISTDYNFMEKLGDILTEKNYQFQMKDGGKDTCSFIETWKPDFLFAHYSDTTMEIDFKTILARIKEKGMLVSDKIVMICPPSATIDAMKQFKEIQLLSFENTDNLKSQIIKII